MLPCGKPGRLIIVNMNYQMLRKDTTLFYIIVSSGYNFAFAHRIYSHKFLDRRYNSSE